MTEAVVNERDKRPEWLIVRGGGGGRGISFLMRAVKEGQPKKVVFELNKKDEKELAL